MKEIIQAKGNFYELIEICSNTPILEYLKQNTSSFVLQQVDFLTMEQLKHSDRSIDIRSRNCIAGYGRLKGNHFRSSGGLKLSDPTGIITGSFIVEDRRIIYDPSRPFFDERDAYVYSLGPSFITQMSMLDVLCEELNRKRQYLIYLGKKLENWKSVDQFANVSKYELLEYATIPEKGQRILKKEL